MRSGTGVPATESRKTLCDSKPSGIIHFSFSGARLLKLRLTLNASLSPDFAPRNVVLPAAV
ncbi:MAG: hypothetical protein BWK77_04480 [Verrucomicrobia bacterium A1]|nr:MAG: hypothetical protein BWK77_04480 [Verrucomicrobia bacterium A1]